MNGMFNGGLFNQNYVNFMMYNNYQGNTEQFKPVGSKCIFILLSKNQLKNIVS